MVDTFSIQSCPGNYASFKRPSACPLPPTGHSQVGRPGSGSGQMLENLGRERQKAAGSGTSHPFVALRKSYHFLSPSRV